MYRSQDPNCPNILQLDCKNKNNIDQFYSWTLDSGNCSTLHRLFSRRILKKKEKLRISYWLCLLVPSRKVFVSYLTIESFLKRIEKLFVYFLFTEKGLLTLQQYWAKRLRNSKQHWVTGKEEWRFTTLLVVISFRQIEVYAHKFTFAFA